MSRTPVVAALYVDRKLGPYPQMPRVDVWDEARDATRYAGPHPVVAHPYCGPWGRLRGQCTKQDAAHGIRAVEQVLAYGGVLEHPAGSLLWDHCNLPKPGQFAEIIGSSHTCWTIEVRQVDWKHEAAKQTWLLLVGVDPAALRPPPFPGAQPTRVVQSRGKNRLRAMSSRRRHLTPPLFAQWLVDMARTVARSSELTDPP